MSDEETEEKTFTEDDVNRIVEGRLAREKAKDPVAAAAKQQREFKETTEALRESRVRERLTKEYAKQGGIGSGIDLALGGLLSHPDWRFQLTEDDELEVVSHVGDFRLPSERQGEIFMSPGEAVKKFLVNNSYLIERETPDSPAYEQVEAEHQQARAETDFQGQLADIQQRQADGEYVSDRDFNKMYRAFDTMAAGRGVPNATSPVEVVTAKEAQNALWHERIKEVDPNISPEDAQKIINQGVDAIAKKLGVAG